ncbi:MAG: sporulation protein YqfD [Oscillospiraceae bacterium]|nr:sporulation protein YqfD [Oscillospiraceae bacterium]
MRYSRGYVVFTAAGDFVERFLNLAARDRIAIWDGHKTGDTYTGATDIKSYRKLRKHAKNAGVRLRISQKEGVPFQRYRYRKRKGLLVGLAIFAAFLFIMSRFIWRVEVSSTGGVPESTIVRALENIGVRPGVPRASIDVRDSERRALLLLHDLSWIALNIEGSIVHVEYSQSVAPPDMIDPNAPCNIIASASGQINALNIYDGQPLVALGDTVMKGDVIVSGITQDRLGQSLFRHAQAQVIARVTHTIEIEVPMQQTRYIETGDERGRNYLGVMGFEIPLFLPFKIPHPYHVERVREPVTLFSLETPVWTLRERYILMEEVPVTLSKEEARKQALLELAATEKVALEGAEIYDKKMGVTTQDGHYILHVEYDCAMDIAEEQEILLDGNEHNIVI